MQNLKIKEKESLLKYEDKKLMKFFNLNHSDILTSLFSKEDNSTNQIKVKILMDNIHKTPRDLLLLLGENKPEKEYFNYYQNLILLLASHNLDESNFQFELGKINEKGQERREKGVYYTPEDISDFIIYNSIFQLITNKFKLKFKPEHPDKIIHKIISLSKNNQKEIINLIQKSSILDPTCGTGAFLVQVLTIKLNIINEINGKISSGNIDDIIDSLHGNDLDPYSTYISKIRIIFKCLYFCKTSNIKNILGTLDKNFTSKNFISNCNFDLSFDLIIGNPPYVEKTKTEDSHIMKYGNTYADTIHNSLNILKPHGVLGFIIPISYISTARMGSLRKFVESQSKYQFVLSYNDRPDCLFSGVHQKLNILFLKKGQGEGHKIFTSDYKYWYKNERKELFLENEFILNNPNFPEFYPKLGDVKELSIFSKINSYEKNLLTLEEGSETLYLNKRAAFWIKSFLTKPDKLNEYTPMKLTMDNLHIANAIFNSSLYWWFWIKVSDCWHITKKELFNFTVPKIGGKSIDKLVQLSRKLDKKLEDTKEKIDSKQTMYEYKHKKCKDVIDEIDEELGKIYLLTPNEINFIKKYKERYRTGQEDLK